MNQICRKLFVLISCALMGFATIPLTPSAGFNRAASSCVRPPSGLVGWWTGDTHPNDVIGTNHMTLFGATYTAGKVGGAFDFDGINDYATRPLPDEIKIANITLEAWVKTNLIGTTQEIVFALPQGGSSGSATGGAGAGLGILANGKVAFAKGSGDGAYDVVSGVTTVTVGTWHHVVGSFDGVTMRVYLDGQEEGAVMDSRPIRWTGGGSHPNPAQLYFGATKSNALNGGSTVADSFFMNGSIDEVGIFNRALDAAEVQAIYEANSEGKCRPLDVSTCQADLENANHTIQLLQTQVAGLQAQSNTLNLENSQLRDQLDTTNQTVQHQQIQIVQLQNQIADLATHNTQLQDQLLQMNTTISAQLLRIQTDFRAAFRNNDFTIPGTTPIEQYQNLIDAILKLNHGRKTGVYYELGGNPQ